MDFPLSWILDHACAPIQYRASIEVAQLSVPAGTAFHNLPYTFPPALLLALGQGRNGTWNDAMLTVPSARAAHFRGVGTVSAVRRLLEYGWAQESPPLQHAKRPLFRLLAEDEDPAFAFELAPARQADPAAVQRARAVLREAAAATLAQAGYEKDPRLRGAASRIVDRLTAFLRSPLAEDPFVRLGNQRVLPPEASPPSFYSLMMLAHMPLFRSERYEVMDLLGKYLARPAPRTPPAVASGREAVPTPHILLGDPLPTPSAAAADVPWTLTWLELVARLGLLRRNDAWSVLFDRLLSDCDPAGVWRPRKGAIPSSESPLVWPSFPLEPSMTGEARWTDATFRLGLIGRLSGRQINLV